MRSLIFVGSANHNTMNFNHTCNQLMSCTL